MAEMIVWRFLYWAVVILFVMVIGVAILATTAALVVLARAVWEFWKDKRDRGQ